MNTVKVNRVANPKVGQDATTFAIGEFGKIVYGGVEHIVVKVYNGTIASLVNPVSTWAIICPHTLIEVYPKGTEFTITLG